MVTTAASTVPTGRLTRRMRRPTMRSAAISRGRSSASEAARLRSNVRFTPAETTKVPRVATLVTTARMPKSAVLSRRASNTFRTATPRAPPARVDSDHMAGE